MVVNFPAGVNISFLPNQHKPPGELRDVLLWHKGAIRGHKLAVLHCMDMQSPGNERSVTIGQENAIQFIPI